MKHEFGHIFGAPDYYSYSDTHEAAIATFDMMCNSSSDHNGFTKWLFGWLSNDDIAYVSKATGDTTVSLAPFETSLGDGKKIAVVAPAIDEQTPLLSEYFIVEYDTGTANNKQTFENYSYSPGFRIFHVNAKAGYDDTELYAHLLSSNNSLRLNLIHNVKNEMKDPNGWVFQDMFFREGDSLTPLDYPNTGLTVDNIYNGSFTGISFTDFVTGDNPSFRVSFSDEQVHQPDPTLSLTADSLNADVRMTIDSDKPIVQRSRNSEQYEEPYLIDSAGNKLTLDVMPIENSVFSYKLSYTKNNPPVSPETEYTLVIPEGYFITGYAQDVPEFRETLTTEKFLGLTFLEYYALDNDRCVSNIFAASDNSYGRIELFADSRKAVFTEYNLSGKADYRNTFDMPDVLGEEERPLSCRVFRLNDGNYSLCITTGVTNYFIKIDRYGKALSEIFTLGDDAVDSYIQNVSRIEFEPYKNGICKLMKSSGNKSAVLLTIDFENAPKITPVNYFEAYFPLDSNSYLRRQFIEDDIYLCLYNSSDEVVADILLDDSFMGAYTENGNIKILFKHTERTAGYHSVKSYYFAIYDSSGSLLAKEELSDSAAENLNNYYTNSIVGTDSGYCLSYNEWGSKETKVYVFDSDWIARQGGVLRFADYAPIIYFSAAWSASTIDLTMVSFDSE